MTSNARILWVIPILVLLHNAEEAFALHFVWGLALRFRWPEVLVAYYRNGLFDVSNRQATDVGLAIVTAVAFVVVGWSAARADDAKRVWVALLVQAVMFLNVIPHVFAAVVMRGYSPGLVTAVALNLPFSIWFLKRARRDQWVSRRAMWMLVPAAIVVHGPLLFLLLKAIAAGSPPPVIWIE